MNSKNNKLPIVLLFLLVIAIFIWILYPKRLFQYGAYYKEVGDQFYPRYYEIHEYSCVGVTYDSAQWNTTAYIGGLIASDDSYLRCLGFILPKKCQVVMIIRDAPYSEGMYDKISDKACDTLDSDLSLKLAN